MHFKFQLSIFQLSISAFFRHFSIYVQIIQVKCVTDVIQTHFIYLAKRSITDAFRKFLSLKTRTV